MVLIRKNLAKKFQNILKNTLTIILAPDGYGKTSYLKHYIKKEKINCLYFEGKKVKETYDFWDQLKEEGSHKGIMPSSLNYSSFPTFEEDVEVFLKTWDTYLQKHLFIVVDDFHCIKSFEINSFFTMIARLKTHYIHFIIVTPYLLDLQLSKVYDERLCYRMNVQDFEIDFLELSKILKKKDIKADKEQIEQLLSYTKGWAPAIELAINAYITGGSLFDTSQLEELLERGKLFDIQKEDISLLIELSLLSCFSIEQVHSISNNVHIIEVIVNLARSQLFIEKKDLDIYTFSPLFKSYLREGASRYNVQEKKIYETIADWYIEKDQYLDAIQMLMEGGVFERIIKILSESNFSYVDIAPQLIQDVFHRMPREYYYQAPLVYLCYIRDVTTNIDVYKGMKLLEEFKTELLEGKYQGDKERLMGEYYYIRAFSGFNDVKLMMNDFHKAYDCFKGEPAQCAYPGMIASFGSCQLLYLYYHTHGKLKELCETITEEVEYFIQISYGCNAGSECQVQAEYLYVTGQYEEVERLVRTANKIAYLNRQTSICICASFQLGRLAIMEDNPNLYQAVIKDLVEIRQGCKIPLLLKEVDCALTYLAIINGEMNQVSNWIVDGNIDINELMHEAEGLPYIIYMLYLLKTKKYKEAEECCLIIGYTNQKVTHAFNYIYSLMGRTIIYFNTEKKEQAYSTLKQLLQITEKDHIISLYLEFYEELYPIFLEYKTENDFEEEVYTRIKNRYTYFNGKVDVQLRELTDREKEIARLYIDFLTSKTIAERLMISHNTVLTHIKTIYAKLGINTKKELIELMERRR